MGTHIQGQNEIQRHYPSNFRVFTNMAMKGFSEVMRELLALS